MAIELDNSRVRLAVRPELGASVSLCEWFDGREWQPVLHQAASNAAGGNAMHSALFPMVPFPNRARSNILAAGGVSYRVTPNTNEPFAIHGTGWERVWRVLAQTPVEARLGLTVADDYVFDFESAFRISIEELTVTLELTIQNTGKEPIPVGLGFHPYFPRLRDTHLQFRANAFFPQGPDLLPMDPVRLTASDNYEAASPLPDTKRDNAFGGWDGTARIGQPSLGYELSLHASSRSRELMFFAPAGQPYFALEPQSSLSGETTAGREGRKGLDVLEPGCSFRVETELSVIPIQI